MPSKKKEQKAEEKKEEKEEDVDTVEKDEQGEN